MQSVNELWRTLRALPDTEIEWRFDINGVTYGPENEVSHDANHALFSEFGFGNATCGGLNLQLYADNIPKGAEIKRFCRLVNGAQVSEWLPMGVYYINRRSEEDGYWEIEAFDNMRKAEKVWEPDQSLTFPMPMDEAVTEICRVLGFTLDSRTTLSHAYTLDYPESEQTYRRTLQMIAAAHGGNFVFTGEGKLRLVPLISLPEESFYLVDQNGNPITFGGQRITVGDGESANPFDPNGVKHLVGLDLFSIRDNGKSKPVSRVTLLADDENAYTAGDDTGMELVADCAYATQEMVNALLSTFKGFVYQAFEADGVNLDPAAELGDGITAGGLYSILGELNENGSGYPDIAAPGKEELEDEYPSQGPVTQQFNRKLAQTRSLIAKTAEEVKISVEELDGKYTALSVTLEGVTITDQDGTTKIRGSSIETDSLYVNAANVRGKLTASQVEINLSGSIKWTDLSAEVQNEINDAYAMAEDAEAAAADAADTVDGWRYNGGTYIDGSMLKTGTVMASSLIGGEVTLLTSAEREAGGMDITGASTSTYAIELWSYGALRMEAYNGAAYLGSGDAHVHVEEDATTITNGNVGIEFSNHVWIGGNMFPNSPDDYLCGNANYPWSAVYISTGACISSDENKKNSIEPLPEKYLTMIDNVTPLRFKLNSGTSGRYHAGFGARNVKAAMDIAGIADTEFGGWVRDYDEEGNEIYMLRYEEYIPIQLAKAKQQDNRFEALEARVARLEARA